MIKVTPNGEITREGDDYSVWVESDTRILYTSKDLSAAITVLRLYNQMLVVGEEEFMKSPKGLVLKRLLTNKLT